MIIGGVVIIGVGLVIGLTIGRKEPGEEKSQPQVQESFQEPVEQEESFTGKLKDALLRGQSMKCTWKKDDDNQAMSYLKDQQIYTEVTQAGEKMYSIMKDDCVWSWGEKENQGFKICSESKLGEPEEEWDLPEQYQVQTPDLEYSCVPVMVSDSRFDLPSQINFVSFEELMGQ